MRLSDNNSWGWTAKLEVFLKAATIFPVGSGRRLLLQDTGDKTTLLISHRLGITSVVDRILVFRDGNLIEDGSHQKLMEKELSELKKALDEELSKLVVAD